MKLLKPPRLRRGDVIGLIAPASPPKSARQIEESVRYLESRGYRVKLGRNVKQQHGYLAGTDEERLSDLNDMLGDRQVNAVFALRGGYGTGRLLPRVNYRAVRRQPKIVAGYSDMTALQLALFRKAGLVTFSGPMLAADWHNGLDPYTEEHFWRMLTSGSRSAWLPNPSDRPLVICHPGKAEGRLLGGNLSLVLSSLGTPFSPDYRGALLVLEEVDERPHRVDRMLTQLRNAGVLAHLAGMVFGHFTQCGPANPAQPHLTVKQILAEVLSWVNVPAVTGFQYGHIRKKLTVPLGVRARLDTRKCGVTILEPVVE